MKFEQLHTSRLTLVKITPEVYNHVFENNEDEDITAFFGIDTAEGLEREKDRYNNGITMFGKSFLYFLLKDKTNNKTIGWCGYHTWYTDHNRAELGYGLYNDSYKRKGLMTEALQAVLDYGYTEMQLHRVEALTASYNTASNKVLEHFGLTFEGTLREHYYVDGIAEDSLIFSLLKHEYMPG
jgi:ribosomal-protein-alanine N-acetyltransferase